MRESSSFKLTSGKRVLFLTKDPDLIRRQINGELDLRLDAAVDRFAGSAAQSVLRQLSDILKSKSDTV